MGSIIYEYKPTCPTVTNHGNPWFSLFSLNRSVVCRYEMTFLGVGEASNRAGVPHLNFKKGMDQPESLEEDKHHDQRATKHDYEEVLVNWLFSLLRNF